MNLVALAALIFNQKHNRLINLWGGGLALPLQRLEAKISGRARGLSSVVWPELMGDQHAGAELAFAGWLVEQALLISLQNALAPLPRGLLFKHVCVWSF